MKTKLLSATLAFMIFCASCKKSSETLPLTENSTINNLKVSSAFDWSTTNEINFSIGTSDSRYQNLIHVIYIYDMDPNQGGKILAKGSATLLKPFNTKIAFTSTTKSIYVLKSAPNGDRIGQEVDLSSKNMNVSFSATAVSKSSTIVPTGINGLAKFADAIMVNGLIPSCERQVTNENNINMTKKEVVCYNATTDKTISINNANSGGTIIFSAPGRKITIQNFNHTGVNIVIQANTTVSFGGTEVKANETWTNYGTLELTGKMDLKGTINNNNTAKFGFLQINSSGTLNNYCKLYADDLQADAVLNNYNYVLVKNTTRVNANGKVNLIGATTSGAYYETKDLLKGNNKVNFFGTNATSLLKITGSIDGNLLLDAKQTNNSQIVGGTINLSTPVPNIPIGFFNAPASLGNGAYIASSDCMPTSNGTAPTPPTPIIKDKDNDGVNDNDDDYPNDQTKAYKNYSVNYDAGGSTLAFEDNWPTKGDYDLNDVVISYRYLVVSNADNIVVEVNANYSLIATGADFTNGAGIQFPLAAGKAKITQAPAGVYLEAKQDSVVLILFDNSRKVQPTGNTVLGKPTSPAVNFDITFEITDGPEMKNFGIVVFNPFIWNAGLERGYETHLFGKNPTSLVKKELFETKDDFSKSNGKYYSTKDNLPWVIEVPIAKFAYPIEGASIDKAYTNFSSWATSSGVLSAGWYTILSGGATSNLIYPVK